MIKRVLSCLAALAIFWLFLPAAGGAAAPGPTGLERILSMDVAAAISEVGVLSIEERIVFEAAGREIKRGLVRRMPVYWSRPDGSRMKLSYSSIEVRRDGAPEPWRSEGGARQLELYIGSPDRLLTPGIYEYRIKYDVAGAVLRKDGVDSLYWNATGNEWAFTIERAGFRLTLPKAAEAERDDRVIERFYYTGSAGERGEDAEILPDGGMASTKALTPGEGLTVFYSWPTEISSNVEVLEFRGGLAYALIPSPGSLYVFAPTALLLTVYIFFARRWRVEGAGKSVIPIFDPPSGFTPGEARFIFKGRYDVDAFAADMLHLVDKKCLFLATINDADGKEIKLLSRYPVPGDKDSLKDAGWKAPGGQSFYDQLFAGRCDAVELDAKKPLAGSRIVGDLRLGSGTSLAATFRKFAAARRKKNKALFKPARGVLIGGLSLWMAIMGVLLGLFRSGDAVAGFIALFMLPLVPLIMLGAPLFMLFRRSPARRLSDQLAYYFFMALYLGVGAVMAWYLRPFRLLGLLFGEYFGVASVWEAAAPGGMLLSVVMAAIFFVLGWFFMPRHSAEGAKLYALAQGVRCI